MSTPTVLRPDVTAFAAGVRAQLDDLPPEVVEELAGGLDADLAELAAESDDPLDQRLGDPAAYAAELRAAADLPPRGVAPRRRSGVGPALASLRTRATRTLEAQPWWPWAKGFGQTLRPAWWVLRAWVAWVLVDAVFGSMNAVLPRGFVSWVVLLAGVVVSVELGRGRWSAPWLRGFVVAGNVLAVLMLPVALDHVDRPAQIVTEWVETGPGEGLYLDGMPVANLFPYGPDGQPLTGVQILDDRGRPVATGEDIRGWPDGEGWLSLVPSTDALGRAVWNAYPLQEARTDEYGARPGPRDEIRPAPLPERSLPPLAGPQPQPEPTTAAPTDAATPQLTPTDVAPTEAAPTEAAPTEAAPTP